MDSIKYFEILREIKTKYQTYWQPHISPYDIYDWITLLTPIEFSVWEDIRYLTLPFYPQFPIGKYFVDFADPVKKIFIEVNSKKWHTDPQKDAKRIKEIENLGWKSIIITGYESMKKIPIYEGMDMFLEEYEEKFGEYNKYDDDMDTISFFILKKIRDESYLPDWIKNGRPMFVYSNFKFL